MEVLATFVLIALFVLGALCLAVLEYQNFRAKPWQQFWSTHVPNPPETAASPQPSQSPDARPTPARVA